MLEVTPMMQHYLETKEEYKDCILGIQFIKLFNYSLFDFDKKQIAFYSDLISINEHNINTKSKTILIIINTVTFIIFLTSLGIIYTIINVNKLIFY